jgi:simple sugar transport system ATP-binding protein
MTAQLEERSTSIEGGDVLLDAEGLTKSYGQVHALRDGSVQVRAGRVTAIIGDNGAGKSTLVGCLSGIHKPDGGALEVGGKAAEFAGPQQARRAGIETVYQDLALVDTLRVWQNLYLGREEGIGRGPLRWLKRRTMRREAARMVGALAVNVPSVDARVHGLSGGQRQAVALARAAGWGSRIVILDEPTAALGVQETAKVEEMILGLKSQGLGLVLVSHNFDQVLRVADDVYVMRSGRTVAHRPTEGTTGPELVSLVTGATVDAFQSKHHHTTPEGKQ